MVSKALDNLDLPTTAREAHPSQLQVSVGVVVIVVVAVVVVVVMAVVVIMIMAVVVIMIMAVVVIMVMVVIMVIVVVVIMVTVMVVVTVVVVVTIVVVVCFGCGGLFLASLEMTGQDECEHREDHRAPGLHGSERTSSERADHCATLRNCLSQTSLKVERFKAGWRFSTPTVGSAVYARNLEHHYSPMPHTENTDLRPAKKRGVLTP